MPQFLHLPPEIIIGVLCYLDLPELVSVSEANKSLNHYIRTDQVLRYQFKTRAAMVENNPHVNQSTAERLSTLSSRETGWSQLTFDFRMKIPVQHTPSGIYDMTGGIYLLGDQTKKTLHYCTLPSKRTDPVLWKQINIDKTLVDMGLAIYEHDLVAIVTTTPRSSGYDTHVIEIMLLQFSTGKPHPLARNPVLFVTESRWPRPAIGIEIVGEHLALVVNHFLNPFQPRDRLYVYEWKTGNVKMEVLAAHHTYSGVVFLSPTLLLLPNTRNSTLDIWEIPDTAPSSISPSSPGASSTASFSPPSPQSPSSPSTTAATSSSNSGTSEGLNDTQFPILCLGLPSPSPGQLIITFSCRGEPNPTLGGTPYSSQPFHSASADAIIIFNIRVQHLGIGRSSTFSMFVHRKSLLALCQLDDSPPEQSSSRQETNDDEDEDDGDGDGDGEDEDDDAASVDRESGPAHPTTGPFMFQNWLIGDAAQEGEPADNARTFIPWDSWGPAVTRWFDAADMPTRWITTSAGQRCVLSAEPRRRGHDGGAEDEVGDDDDDDEEEEEEAPMKVLDFNPLTVKRALLERGRKERNGMEMEMEMPGMGGQLKVVTTTSRINQDAFEEAIDSSLPYVALSYPRKGKRYDFEGVLMDEERLLGLRTSNDDTIIEIDIMHLGIGDGEYV